MSTPPGLDLALVRRLEAHALEAWPPAFIDRADDGWVFRATPGLSRGRSNHALPPARALSRDEIADALGRTRAFAAWHGVRTGIQVSPLELHGQLRAAAEADGWSEGCDVLVMTAAASAVLGGGEPLAVEVADRADRAWLDAWAVCERRNDVQAHADTVFGRLRGRARFVRAGSAAVGIGVEVDGVLGLFCLAVVPEARRGGIGSALVRAIVGGSDAPLVYLQVEADNAPAVALYDRLSFETVYRYRHCVAPD